MATIRRDLTQRDFEAFETDYNPRIRGADGELDLYGQQRFYGASVRAAAVAGWFTEPVTQEDVDAMTPKEVAALWKQVTDLYQELTAVDPNS